MAFTGQTIEHPVTGERILFLKTAEDTRGELLQLDVRVGPHRFDAGEHIHPRQDERFAILSGRLRYRIDGIEGERGRGRVVHVPRGARHTWWNVGEEPLHMVVDLRPALRTELFFESYFALAHAGRTNELTGMPGRLQTAVLLREFRDEVRLARPPLIVQRPLIAALAWLGRRRGHRAAQSYPPLPLPLPA
jgi:mannose-6-phosphate isomerase-like protein (cupin superfamily)